MQITCPHCGRAGRAPDHAAGKVIKCPACGKGFVASRSQAGDVRVANKPAPPELEPAKEEEPQAGVCVVCARDIRVPLACKHCKKEVCSERCLREHLEFAHENAPKKSGAPHLGIVSMIFGFLAILTSFTNNPVAILIPSILALGFGQASYYREPANPYAAVGRVIGLLGLLLGGTSLYMFASRP